MRIAVFFALVFVASCEAAVAVPAKNGWGTPTSASVGAPYPGKYPRVAEPVRLEREAILKRELPDWRVAVAASGFFAAADTIHVPYSMTLTTNEIESAQRLIDRHPDLFGLSKPERLVRWHDGLYYISPVGDPRYGIALLHARGNLKLIGHLWPGFTMRSSARKDAASLIAPWAGRRFTSQPHHPTPCDPVHIGDCRQEDGVTTTTITEATASYVVHATLGATDIEVRELLVLPNTKELIADDPSKGAVPPAIDARTGEEVAASAYGPSMCELGGVCVLWGWFKDEGHLEFTDEPPPRDP